MDSLTLFGLLAVSAMLVFYALEDRSPWHGLASLYGFLQGWPFGVVEAIWSAVAVPRWRMRVKRPSLWRR